MGTMIALTLLALPLAVLTTRIGRRHWVRRRTVARVRAELFRHWVRDESSGRRLIRP
jgi:hypothetical protein